MNTLTYNGFLGVFNYIEDEDILHGKIEGITDLVTFEGASIKEVKEAFREAVDDYIEICKEVKKEPLKSFKGSFNVRLTPQLHTQVFFEAKRQNMNINQFVKKALQTTIQKKQCSTG